jgi:hypothetical protein
MNPMIHSVLLIGQSNMAGRGFKDEVPPIENERIKVLVNGRWQNMFFPVSKDRPFAGISLAESFADEYSKSHNVDVGLIPCADGGTYLDQWMPGELLFDHAVLQAKLALRTSEITAVLWHQGEADCQPELYPLYEEKCLYIFNSLRKELCLYDIPVLVGGLGDFLENCTVDNALKNYKYLNNTFMNMEKKDSKIGFVSAEGLTANPDNLHFNAKSLREFGIRYYKKFCLLENKNKIFTEKKNMYSEAKTEMEKL